MKILTLGLFLLLVFSITTVPTVFADEDEDEWDDDEYERQGSGEMAREQEREREREHENDDDAEGIALGGGIPDAIFYGTIAVIVVSVAYTGFKIYKTTRPKLKSR